MKTWGKHTISLLFIAIFTIYYCGVNLYSHQHIVDGVKITHSHPYTHTQGGTTPHHSHNASEINTISFLSLVQFTIIAAVLLSIFAKVVHTVFNKHVSFHHKDALFGFKSLRAPPVY